MTRRARTHHTPPAYRKGIRLEKVAPRHSRDIGEPAGQADAFRDPGDDVAGHHRQSFIRCCDAFEGALGEHTVGMEQAAATYGRAQSDGQRGDVGNLHRSGVPHPVTKQTQSGLTPLIQGINHRTCFSPPQRGLFERPI